MEGPVANCIRGDVKREFLAWSDQYGVLSRLVVMVTGDEFKKHAVQMNRMRHHRVIDQGDPHTLALLEDDRVFDF